MALEKCSAPASPAGRRRRCTTPPGRCGTPVGSRRSGRVPSIASTTRPRCSAGDKTPPFCPDGPRRAPRPDGRGLVPGRSPLRAKRRPDPRLGPAGFTADAAQTDRVPTGSMRMTCLTLAPDLRNRCRTSGLNLPTRTEVGPLVERFARHLVVHQRQKSAQTDAYRLPECFGAALGPCSGSTFPESAHACSVDHSPRITPDRDFWRAKTWACNVCKPLSLQNLAGAGLEPATSGL